MPPLVPTGRPHIAPLPPITDRVNRSFVASPQQTDRYLPELVGGPQTSWLASQTRPSTGFSRRRSILQEEAEGDQEGIGSDSSDDTSLSPGEASDPRTSGHMDHLTLWLMMLRDSSEERERFQERQPQEVQTVTDSNSEAIRRLRERLLEESSDEEEVDQCRICQSGPCSLTNPLLTPCQCSGSLQFIHHDCLKKWIQTRILSGSELSAVKTCELCKGSLTLDLDNFDLDDYYQRHGPQQQADDLSVDLDMLLQQMFLDLVQVIHSRNDSFSRILRQPIVPHTLRMRVSRAGQRSNPTPGTSDT
ncbi:putative E3 ubiquitin-protein ligase MARCHF10 [Centroberyx gerrardi]